MDATTSKCHVKLLHYTSRKTTIQLKEKINIKQPTKSESTAILNRHENRKME